jgi:predicted porin
MKKSLFAVAAMTAFAGAAQAQSSVTVSGVIDEGYTSVTQTVGNAAQSAALGNTQGASTKQTAGLKDSAWTSNRLIFSGTEDMGGGLKTMFFVESGMSLASSSPENGGLGGTGATNNGPGPFGNVRQAFLGLGSKYGNLSAGWQYTPEYFQRISNIGGSANSLGIAATTASNGGIAVASRGTLDSMNAFKYESPKFMDATFTAMVGTSTLTQKSNYSASTAAATAQSLNAPAAAGAQDITQTGLGQAYAVNWAKGNAQATVSFSREVVSNATAYIYSLGGTSTSIGQMPIYGTSQQNFMASGSYDFGLVKVMGLAANRRITTNANTGTATTAITNPVGSVRNVDIFSVGAFVPVTSTIKLGANYAYAKDGFIGKDLKNQAFQTSVQYAMSKRTTAYVLAARAVSSSITPWSNTANFNAITTSAVTSANQYSVGLAHTF